MTQYADILVFDRNGQVAVIIEAKNKLNTTKEWAAKMRRNMFSHDLLPAAPYFLLALPDVFYIWKETTGFYGIVDPMLIINPKPFLQPFFDIIGVTPKDISGQRFELIISTWLNNVLTSTKDELLQSNQEWVIEAGVYEKISGGYIKVAEAV